MRDRVVVGVAGMPGAGKATVISIAEGMDCGIVVMGDEVRLEAKRQGLELTPTNVGRVMLRLREAEGPGVVARRCIPKVEKMKNRVVIVDGLRSHHEVAEFKRRFQPFSVLAIHSSPETRFRRLSKRRRRDDPETWETFSDRDRRELLVGLGNVIASAETLIVNDGKRVHFKNRVRRFLEDVIRGAD